MKTPEEFAAEMKEISVSYDTEGAHARADELMCQVLRALGYEAGILVFEDMDKWYA